MIRPEFLDPGPGFWPPHWWSQLWARQLNESPAMASNLHRRLPDVPNFSNEFAGGFASIGARFMGQVAGRYSPSILTRVVYQMSRFP